MAEVESEVSCGRYMVKERSGRKKKKEKKEKEKKDMSFLSCGKVDLLSLTRLSSGNASHFFRNQNPDSLNLIAFISDK